MDKDARGFLIAVVTVIAMGLGCAQACNIRQARMDKEMADKGFCRIIQMDRYVPCDQLLNQR